VPVDHLSLDANGDTTPASA